MDRLAVYRAAVIKTLGDFAALVNRTTTANELDTVCLFDEVKDLYMVYRIGWEKNNRISTVSIFIRIIAGKIWVEENWTRIELEKVLMDAGVAKKDICVGWVPPFMREPDECVMV